MKRYAVILAENLTSLGLTKASWGYVANVHDEVQIECVADDGIPELIAEEAEKAMVQAGEYFNMRCLIEGEAKIGNNWAETH